MPGTLQHVDEGRAFPTRAQSGGSLPPLLDALRLQSLAEGRAFPTRAQSGGSPRSALFRHVCKEYKQGPAPQPGQDRGWPRRG